MNDCHANERVNINIILGLSHCSNSWETFILQNREIKRDSECLTILIITQKHELKKQCSWLVYLEDTRAHIFRSLRFHWSTRSRLQIENLLDLLQFFVQTYWQTKRGREGSCDLPRLPESQNENKWSGRDNNSLEKHSKQQRRLKEPIVIKALTQTHSMYETEL